MEGMEYEVGGLEALERIVRLAGERGGREKKTANEALGC